MISDYINEKLYHAIVNFDGNACRFQLENTGGPKLSPIETGGKIDISGPKGPQY